MFPSEKLAGQPAPCRYCPLDKPVNW